MVIFILLELLLLLLVSGDITGNVTATQITVGNSFLRSNALGIGQTTTAGRNAGVGTDAGTIIYNLTIIL